jgi:hypothetical protein
MRRSPLLRAVCAALLLSATVAVIQQAPAQAATRRAVQGIQFGHPVDLGSVNCDVARNINLFLENTELVARTGWVRIDLRGAGAWPGCDPAAAYQDILARLANASGGAIKVIGLLSNDFMFGQGLGVSPASFAAEAGRVACSSPYADVDVWEIWNEPTHPFTVLDSTVYAEMLGLSAAAIKACSSDKVISGGINPAGEGVPDPRDYLDLVSAALATHRYGGYASLNAAVDGIGGHPYVTAVGEDDAGHPYIDAFVWALYDKFREPVYLTEFGWSVGEFTDQIQCLNLISSFDAIVARGTAQVPAATWFTLRDFGDPSKNMGLYTESEGPRPSLNGYINGNCGGATDGAFNPSTQTLSWQSNVTAAAARNEVNAVSFEVAMTKLPNIFYTIKKTVTATSVSLSAFNPPLEAGSYLWRVTTIKDGVRIPSASWNFAYLGAPAAPSGQSAVATSASTVAVGWADNSNNETNFQITNGVTTVTAPMGSTGMTWSGISPGTYMCFAIRAVNTYGESAWTPYACTTTPQLPPAAPSNLAAAPNTGTSILLTWADNSANETGFEVSNGTTTVPVAANATSYSWGGLANGTNMCFRVRAVNSAGPSAWSAQVCSATPTIPAAPTGQTATVASGTSIRVNWADRSTNEIGFEISNGTTSQVVGANSTAYTWGGLANGTYMCYRVRSYSLAGYSAWTPYACATTPTIPVAPNAQTATPVSGSSIRVNWADRSTNEIGFEISNGTTSQVVGANSTSYTWGGLANGTYMCFKVRSYSLAGYSAWTPYACATTFTVPVAPAGQTAVALNANSIRINWTDRSGNETGFQIFDGVNYFSVGANITTFTRTGLNPGTYMCFAIRSQNAAGYSAFTPYACTTTPSPPPAPSGQSAVALNSSQIRFTWRDNSSNETSFQVFDGVNYFTVGANSTTFIRSGLASRTYMCFAVRSYNAAGYSAWTPYGCATTL